MKALEPFAAADFDVSATHEQRGFDTAPRWYIKLTKRAVERHADGRKKQGIGANEFVGVGIRMSDAIANLLDNAERMVEELRMAANPQPIEPNMDAATAKEQPVKASGEAERDARVKQILATHGNSATSLATLIHSGVITPNEARAAQGLPPINKAA